MDINALAIILGIVVLAAVVAGVVFYATRKRGPNPTERSHSGMVASITEVPSDDKDISMVEKDDFTTTQSRSDSTKNSALIKFGARVIIGLVAFILLIILYIDTNEFHEYASETGASAIQITQIYSQATFEALIIIGAAVVLYIITRCVR